MDDDGARRLVVLRDVAQVEADGELEVKLHGGALETTLEGVEDGDIDLRAVEGAVAGVELPLLARLVQRLGQRSLRLVPDLDLAEVTLGASRELHFVRQAEHAVDLVEKLEELGELVLHLIRAAEDVRVVLLETANAGKAVQSAAELVAVEDAEIREAR